MPMILWCGKGGKSVDTEVLHSTTVSLTLVSFFLTNCHETFTALKPYANAVKTNQDFLLAESDCARCGYGALFKDTLLCWNWLTDPLVLLYCSVYWLCLLTTSFMALKDKNESNEIKEFKSHALEGFGLSVRQWEVTAKAIEGESEGTWNGGADDIWRGERIHFKECAVKQQIWKPLNYNEYNPHYAILNISVTLAPDIS